MSLQVDYILDTNIISILVNENAKGYDKANNMLEKIGDSRVLIPVIATGEIEFGLKTADLPKQEEHQKIRQFLGTFQQIDFTRHMVDVYSDIRAKLWLTYGPKKKRLKKPKTIEDLFKNRITEGDLRTDERDLLIASMAAARNCVLVTANQKGKMKFIKKAAKEVEKENPACRVQFEDWTI